MQYLHNIHNVGLISLSTRQEEVDAAMKQKAAKMGWSKQEIDAINSRVAEQNEL